MGDSEEAVVGTGEDGESGDAVVGIPPKDGVDDGEDGRSEVGDGEDGRSEVGD